jgi:hypothetical protein
LVLGEASLNRFLSKDFLSGLLFIGFGLAALWFGRNLAMGTAVRMGPGYVPHMLAEIMMILGCIISLVALITSATPRERETVWIPVGIAAVVFIVVVRFLLTYLYSAPPPFLLQMSKELLLLIAVTGIIAVLLGAVLVSALGRMRAETEGTVDLVETPHWKPITLVTIGIFVFALMFERTGLFPSLVALILIASYGGGEFKLTEVLGNIAVLTIMCVLVFKVGLKMNISIIAGVW